MKQMNTIKRDVYVLKNTIKIPIEVTKGTDAITFEFTVRDYNLPATAAAVAYAYRMGMKKPNSTLCDVSGNVISFQPSANFFEVGNNELQIRVINEDKSLISFKEKVKCSDSMGFPDEEEEADKSLIEQIIAQSGKESGERKAADEKERSERKTADETEKSERQKEIATERARIDQLTKMGEGSTTGDAELADIRAGNEGATYSNAGNAVRAQTKDVPAMMDNLQSPYVDISLLEQGSLNNTGTEITSSKVLRSVEFHWNKNGKITAPSGYKIAIANYAMQSDESGQMLQVYQSATDYGDSQTSSKADGDTEFRRLLIKRSDGADINAEDLRGKITTNVSDLRAMDVLEKMQEETEQVEGKIYRDSFVPEFGNGSLGNFGNVNAIALTKIVPLYGANALKVSINKEPDEGYYWKWSVAFYKADTGNAQINNGGDKASVYFREEYATKTNEFTVQVKENAVGFSIGLYEVSKESETNKCIQSDRYRKGAISIVRLYTDYVDQKIEENINKEQNTSIYNSKHVPGRSYTQITLLHFSDLHADKDALARIMKTRRDYGDAIDDAICTGDIVANNQEKIETWWDASVLTCIGNHDSARYYNDGKKYVYDWTELSITNRDAYYIAPFESGWGIVHETGKSYYYKDYSESKMRLIVLDAMLYSSYESDKTLATTQTKWFENLLDDAITNEIHILIAIHAPHGGASPINCNFSKYGATTMPTYADCNTPSEIIDLVATKISNGLNFVGYIVGHTHQDNVWDATGDGTQLMYCITCANVSYEPQWKNSDQYRGTSEDAFNLITIDTMNNLVKIVRAGGANTDWLLRKRNSICINYKSGKIISEN